MMVMVLTVSPILAEGMEKVTPMMIGVKGRVVVMVVVVVMIMMIGVVMVKVTVAGCSGDSVGALARTEWGVLDRLCSVDKLKDCVRISNFVPYWS